MYTVRRFPLVLCANVRDSVTEYNTRALEHVNTEMCKGGFDYLLHEPLIITEVLSPYTRFYGGQAGSTRRYAICSSAL